MTHKQIIQIDKEIQNQNTQRDMMVIATIQLTFKTETAFEKKKYKGNHINTQFNKRLINGEADRKQNNKNRQQIYNQTDRQIDMNRQQ